MKIQINGFDIEINTDEANLSIKVIDADGKELSNNTYEQSIADSEENLNQTEIPSAEDTATEETEDTTSTEETDATTETEEEITEEGYMPTFDSFKKSK